MQSRADAATAAGPGLPRLRGFDWRDYVVYVFFAVVLLFFGLTIGDKGFLTVPNLLNITRTTAIIAVIAVAMTFVISAGELDLSVGSTAALSALTAGLVMQAGFGWVAGVAAGLGAGLLVGLINGFFVTVVAIPSFLVTLGMMQFIRGLDMRLTYTNPVPVNDQTFTMIFGSGKLWGIPSLLIWSLAVVALGHVVLRYSPFGRQVLATGGTGWPRSTPASAPGGRSSSASCSPGRRRWQAFSIPE